MIMKSPKFFTTLPKVDSKREKERIIYYPTRWNKCSSRKPNIYITVFNRIRISKLHFTTTRGDLHEKFSCFGAIAAISPIIIIQKILYNDRRYQGHAFITFYLEKDARCALKTRIRYLNGNAIYVHPAKQQPINMHYEVEPMDRRYTNETILAINDKYKKYFLNEDLSFTQKMCYALLKAIDANVPHKIKRTTICDPTSDDDESCSTCPRTWDNVESSSDKDSIPCLEEISSSPVAKIQNEWEFNPEHLHGLDDQKLENFVYSDPLYFDGNQTNFQDPVQLNSFQSENLLTIYTVYYAENKQTIYDPIPQQNEFEIYQGDGYCDTNNQYSILDGNLDPFHVDPSMYPDACGPIINLNAFETENNQLYPLLQVNATFHEYPIYTQPNDINQFSNLLDANHLQVLAPQPIISPEPEIHEYQRNDQYYDDVDTANLIAYDDCSMPVTPENSVNDDTSNASRLIPYQNYTESSLEAVNVDTFDLTHFIPYQNNAESHVEPAACGTGTFETSHLIPYQNYVESFIDAAVNDYRSEITDLIPHQNSLQSYMDVAVGIPDLITYNIHTELSMPIVVNDTTSDVSDLMPYQNYAESPLETTINDCRSDVTNLIPYNNSTESFAEVSQNNYTVGIPRIITYQIYTGFYVTIMVNDGISGVLPHLIPYQNYAEYSTDATVNDGIIYEVPHFIPYQNETESFVEVAVNDGICEVQHYSSDQNYTDSFMEAVVNDGIYEIPHFTPHLNYADSFMEVTGNDAIYQVPNFTPNRNEGESSVEDYTPYQNHTDSSVKTVVNNGIYEGTHFIPYQNYGDCSMKAIVNDEIYKMPHFTSHLNYADSSMEATGNDAIYEAKSSVAVSVNDGICEAPHYTPCQNYADSSMETVVNNGIYEVPHFAPYLNYRDCSTEAAVNNGLYEIPQFTLYHSYADSSMVASVNDGIYDVPHFIPYQDYADPSLEAIVSDGIFELPHVTSYHNYSDFSMEATVNDGIYEVPYFTPYQSYADSSMAATVNAEIYEEPQFTPYHNYADSSVVALVNDGIYDELHFTPYQNYSDPLVEAVVNDGMYELPHFTQYHNYADSSVEATENDGICEVPHFTSFQNYTDSSMEAEVNDGIYEVPHFASHYNYADSSVETTVNNGIYEVPSSSPSQNYINYSMEAAVNNGLYEVPHFSPYHNYAGFSVEAPHFNPYQDYTDCSVKTSVNDEIYEEPHCTQYHNYVDSFVEATVNDGLYEVPHFFPYHNYSECAMAAPVTYVTDEVPNLIPYQNYADCVEETAVNYGRYEIPQGIFYQNYAESFVEIPIHDDTYESPQFIPYRNYPESFGEPPVHDGTSEASHFIPYRNCQESSAKTPENCGADEIPYLIPYQIYADSFVETLKQMEASGNQFSETQFLQSEKSDNDKEATRPLKFNPNVTVDDTNTLISLSEFDHVEIEQRRKYELFHLLPYQNYTESCIEAAVNDDVFEVSYLNSYEIYSEFFEQPSKHFKVYEYQFSDAPFQFLQSEENDLDEELAQSLQCIPNGTVEDVNTLVTFCESNEFAIKQLQESEVPHLIPYQKYTECSVESAKQLQAFEHQFSDAPFQFLQSEEILLDEESTPSLEYNPNETVEIVFSESDTVEIEQLQESEILYLNPYQNFETFKQQFSEAPFQFLQSEKSSLDTDEEGPTQSLQCNTNETDADFTFCESMEIEQLQESEIPNLNPYYRNYAELFEKAARQLEVFKQQFSDGSEKSYFSEEPRQSLQCDTNETVNIDFYESDLVDIEQLQDSESARHFEAFKQQFFDAPFQFLQSEKCDLDEEEIEPIQSLECNPNEAAGITFCEYDTVEIEQLQEFEVLHLNPYQNYVEFFDETTRQLEVFKQQVSGTSEKGYLYDEPKQSLQCSPDETTINFCESDPADIEQLKESQMLKLIPYHNLSARHFEAFEHQFSDAPFQFLQSENYDLDEEPQRLQCNPNKTADNIFYDSDPVDIEQLEESVVPDLIPFEAFEYQFSEAPFQFLQSENSDLDEYQEEIIQTCQCNPNKNIEDANTLFTFCKSDTVEIEQLEDYDEEFKVGTSLNKEFKADPMESEDVFEKIQGEYKIISETPKSAYVVSVRDVATQFPEPGENLINTFTTELDEASLQNMETQTLCTLKNEEDETTALCSTYANVTKCRKQ